MRSTSLPVKRSVCVSIIAAVLAVLAAGVPQAAVAAPTPLASFDVATGAADQVVPSVGRFGSTYFIAWTDNSSANQGELIGRQAWGSTPTFFADVPLDLGAPYAISDATTSANRSAAVSGEHVVWSARPTGSYDVNVYGRSWQGLTVSGPPTLPRFTVGAGGKTEMGDFDAGIGAAGLPAAKRLAVWTDRRNGNYDIYGAVIDGATGLPSADFPICKAKGDQAGPRVSGNRVVWTDARAGYGKADIYGATVNLTTRAVRTVPIAKRTGRQWSADVSKKTVVWVTMVKGKGRVWRCTWGRPKTARRVDGSAATQWYPRIDGRFVVYQREAAPGDYDIWALDTLTRKKTLAAGGSANQQYADLCGNVVVWTEWAPSQAGDIKGAYLPWKAVVTANGKTRLFTRGRDLTIAVSARSNADAIASYRLSYEYDLSSWTGWTLYDPKKATNPAGTYTLPDADGPYSVAVEFDDYSHNYSQAGLAMVFLDRSGPTTYVPEPATVKRGGTAALRFQVMDKAWTTQANVTIKIRTTGGKLAKTLALGMRPAGELFLAPVNTAKFRCLLAKGAYTFTVYAVDLAGNPQSSAGTSTLTVN